ncbi:hypothetical protein GGI15_004534 [Coemansia interrupta]|uniref:Uncharacterized protein n=1 Tax=Coemansia interrupta TaxID=1126814 RepID=A0A9W8H9D0_9FUNG|nr:hypothetical protein GGI15_004534 [Coemansia interrupta]
MGSDKEKAEKERASEFATFLANQDRATARNLSYQQSREAIRAVQLDRYSGADGKTTLVSYIAHVDSMCSLYSVTDDHERYRVAVGGLTPDVSRVWLAQQQILAKEGKRPSLDILWDFLRKQFEPLATEGDAIEQLTELRFREDAPGADFVKHNAHFDRLVARLTEDPGATLTMGLYRATLPHDYKVAAIIQKASTLQEVREAAQLVWQAYTKNKQRVNTTHNSHGSSGMVEYMDVDRLSYDDSLPCSRDEFDNRLRSGMCVYCGRGKHTIAQCNRRKMSTNATSPSGNGNGGGRRNRKKKVQVNAVTTTEVATQATPSAPTSQENPNQGNF